jgi:hypothetical protein
MNAYLSPFVTKSPLQGDINLDPELLKLQPKSRAVKLSSGIFSERGENKL